MSENKEKDEEKARLLREVLAKRVASQAEGVRKGRKYRNGEGINLLKFLGPIIALVGMALLWQGGLMFQTYFASSDWPRVQGKLIKAEIYRKVGRNSSTMGIRGSYSYEYEGTPHLGSKFEISGGSNTDIEGKKKKVADLKAASAAGQPLEVFVNPSDPTDSFIYRELSTDMFLITGLGLMVTWVGWKVAKPLFRSKPAQSGS